jgi:hypothetical protein
VTVTYLGGGTLGDAIPGLSEALDEVGKALQALKAAVDANSALLQSGIDAVSGALQDLENAKDALVSGPIQAVNDKIDAAQDYLASLANVDPFGFLQAALAAIDAARALLESLIPANYLASLIEALNAGIDGLQGQANELIATADDMTDVTQLTAAQMAAIQAMKNALDAAANAALAGLVAFAEQLSQLAASGIHTFWAESEPLSDLGSSLQARLGDTGFDASTNVTGPILIVDVANTAGLAAMVQVFG